MHEQRGDALEHLGALGPRAMRDDIFQFGDERGAGSHRRYVTTLRNTCPGKTALGTTAVAVRETAMKLIQGLNR
jgi:hypothetical protein